MKGNDHGKSNKGHTHTEKTKEKIRKNNRSHELEVRIKISKNNRSNEKEIREKIRNTLKGNKLSDITRKRMSISRRGRKLSEETKRRLRISSIKRIERNLKNNGQLVPNYNPTACKYFNSLMEQTGTFIQHAENGGEFYIKEFGYWVDGYDKENNIVYEYDEKDHFISGELKERDKQRQKEIEDFLVCKFIRIKDEDFKCKE